MNATLVKGILIFSGALPFRPTLTPTPTFTPTVTPTHTPTSTPTFTPTFTPSFTPTYTASLQAIQVSAYDYAAINTQLGGVNYESTSFDSGNTSVNISGIQDLLTNDVSKTSQNKSLSGVEMLSSETDKMLQTTEVNSLEHTQGEFDSVKVNQQVSSVEMIIGQTDKITQTSVLSSVEHTISDDFAKLTANNQVTAIDHVPNDSTQVSVTETITDVGHSLEDPASSISVLTLSNSDHTIYDLSQASFTESLFDIDYIVDTFNTISTIELSSVEMLSGSNEHAHSKASLSAGSHNTSLYKEQQARWQVQLSAVQHQTPDFSHSKSKTALSSVYIEYDRVQKAHSTTALTSSYNEYGRAEKIVFSLTLNFLNHTDNLTDWRIFEKGHSASSLTAVNLLRDDGQINKIDFIQQLDSIQHNVSIIEEKPHSKVNITGVDDENPENQHTHNKLSLSAINDQKNDNAIAKIFGKIDSLYITTQTEKPHSKIQSSGIDYEFNDSTKTNLTLALQEIDMIFGNEHRIGLVMGITDDTNMTIASQPIVVDMNLLGVQDLYQYDPVVQNESVSDIQDVYQYDPVVNQIGLTPGDHTKADTVVHNTISFQNGDHTIKQEKAVNKLVFNNLIHSISKYGTFTTIALSNGYHSKLDRELSHINVSLGGVEHSEAHFTWDNTILLRWDTIYVSFDNA